VADLCEALGDGHPARQAAVEEHGVALNAQSGGMQIPSKQEKYMIMVDLK